MEHLPLTSPNCLYICHCCLTYKSNKKSDMLKHIDKKKQCNISYELQNNLTKNELYELSLNHRFYFLFDYNKLLFEDYFFIINHFNKQINYIKYEDIIKDNNTNDNNISNLILEEVNNKINENKENKIFECMKCNKKYKYKKDLIKHLKNKKNICYNNQLINNMIKEYNLIKNT
jgi:hypothetical protein